METIKKILVLFCVVFSCATLISCLLNLSMGYETDTYIHIIDRAALTFIGSIVLIVVLELKRMNKYLNFILPYVIFIVLAMLYVYISGFWEELHPNAYRDVFLNDTIAYVIVYVFVKAYTRVKIKIANKNGIF